MDDIQKGLEHSGPAVETMGGGTEVLIVSYQEITGCLNPGAHPGSYNGQDAYNDMLVIDNGKTDFVHRGG